MVCRRWFVVAAAVTVAAAIQRAPAHPPRGVECGLLQVALHWSSGPQYAGGIVAAAQPRWQRGGVSSGG